MWKTKHKRKKRAKERQIIDQLLIRLDFKYERVKEHVEHLLSFSRVSSHSAIAEPVNPFDELKRFSETKQEHVHTLAFSDLKHVRHLVKLPMNFPILSEFNNSIEKDIQDDLNFLRKQIDQQIADDLKRGPTKWL